MTAAHNDHSNRPLGTVLANLFYGHNYGLKSIDYGLFPISLPSDKFKSGYLNP